MWTLLLVVSLLADVPREGGALVPAPAGPVSLGPLDLIGPVGPAPISPVGPTGPIDTRALGPLDVSSRPNPYPLSPSVFAGRPASAPWSWKDPLAAPAPRPTRDPLRDPLDLEWLIAPRSDGFELRRDDHLPRIDPYDFSARPPLLEVHTSTWMDPWRERELYESLYEVRDQNGATLRIGVSSSDCWWGPPR